LAKSIDDPVTWAKDHNKTADKLDKSASCPKVARVFLKRPGLAEDGVPIRPSATDFVLEKPCYNIKAACEKRGLTK